MGQVITVALLIVVLSVLAWCIFWGVIGVAVARARDWSQVGGAALCIALGPIGLLLVIAVSRSEDGFVGADRESGWSRFTSSPEAGSEPAPWE